MMDDLPQGFTWWDNLKLNFGISPTEKRYHEIWSERTDEAIIHSYEDSLSWLQIKIIVTGSSGVAESCRKQLDTYIIPQMKKRGIREYDDDQIKEMMKHWLE